MNPSPLTSLRHIGFLVKDLDRAIAHFEALGIGPFEPLRAAFVRREVLGQPVTGAGAQLKIRVAHIGPIELELIEPGEGKSPWREALETRGEGVEHLGFFVDDIDLATAEMAGKGFTILRRGWFEGGGGNAFVDAAGTGGVHIEMIQWPATGASK